MREFEEDGNPENLEDAKQYLGMVASEELQKYGVSKAFRTISNKDKEILKVKSASVSYEEGEEGFFDEDEDEEIIAGERLAIAAVTKLKVE